MIIITTSERLTQLILSFQQLPYFFVGTGISMRYSNAPSWDDLLYEIWRSIHREEKIKYDKLKQKIEYELQTNMPDVPEDQKKYHVNPRLASELQQQFNKAFYEDDIFESKTFLPEESNEIICNKLDPFKYYIASNIHKLSIDEKREEYKELTFLRKNQNKIAGVITTNYDLILEDLFPDFEKLIGQDNMLLSNTNNIFEIFKIHGCASKPNSLVITQEDYIYFNRKLKYLSAKLLTIFVEHPIIFIGYGMGDLNILLLFEEIANCLTPDELERTKQNFIFITPSFGEDDHTNTKEISFGNKRIYMTELVLNDYSVFYDKLSLIQSSMPIKLMRKLQDMLTNYIYSTSTTNNIIFGNLNSPDIDEEKTAILVGKEETVSQMGFDYYTIDDILEDILFDNKPFLVNEKLLSKTFKNIRSISGTTLLPIYKYVSILGLNCNQIPSNYNTIKSYEDLQPNTSEKRNCIKSDIVFNSIDAIIESYPNHIPKQIAYIKQYASRIDTESLGDYLREKFRNGSYFQVPYYSSYKRLIALYDFKKYKK